jgi:magnesium-transporting ATPase (P-type)
LKAATGEAKVDTMAQSVSELVRQQKTMHEHISRESAGLTNEEIQQRRETYGLNLLPSPPRVPLWRRLLSQLVHFFALMLWIAGGLAILAGMPQLGFAIFVVILLNGLFAFIQEYRAEKAGERLRDLLPRRATVIRDGARQSVDAVQLVPDDVVVLTAGDRISADMRISRVHSFLVDTSTLRAPSRSRARPLESLQRRVARRGSPELRT